MANDYALAKVIANDLPVEWQTNLISEKNSKWFADGMANEIDVSERNGNLI